MSRLVGAPSGYVGFDDGGQLTKRCVVAPTAWCSSTRWRRRRRRIQHPAAAAGRRRLTDSKGTTVNFRNTLVVFTSNVGSSDILDLASAEGGATTEAVREKVMDALKARFRPEFLNRIDEFVTFESLGKGQLEGIVGIELQKVNKRLMDKELSLSVTEGGKRWLAEKGFDPVFGARPLKRTIQREVETPIAKKLLGEKVAPGSTLLLDAQPGDQQLSIQVVPNIDYVPSEDGSARPSSSSSSSLSTRRKTSCSGPVHLSSSGPLRHSFDICYRYFYILYSTVHSIYTSSHLISS